MLDEPAFRMIVTVKSNGNKILQTTEPRSNVKKIHQLYVLDTCKLD